MRPLKPNQRKTGRGRPQCGVRRLGDNSAHALSCPDARDPRSRPPGAPPGVGRMCGPEPGLSSNGSRSRSCDCGTSDCQRRGAFSRCGGSRRPQQRGGPCRSGRTRRPAGAWGPTDRRTPRRADGGHVANGREALARPECVHLTGDRQPGGSLGNGPSRAPPLVLAGEATVRWQAGAPERDRTTDVSRTFSGPPAPPRRQPPRPTDDNRGRGILHRTAFRASPQAGPACPWVTSDACKHSYVNYYCLRGPRCPPAMLESQV